MSNKIVADYMEAFQKCHPAHSVSVKFHGINKQAQPTYYVYIDGDKGQRALSAGELLEATKDFLR